MGVREELAPTGTLRVAVNYGNPALAQREPVSGEPRGVSVDIARALAHRLDLPIALSTFDAAGRVFEALLSGSLDLVFLAIDPARAGQILFTAPYGIIEGTCLVRADCPCARLGEFDRPGVRIAVGRGSAFDLFLSRHLRHATLARAQTSAQALELFIEAGLEAAAGLRPTLSEYACARPGLRVLEESFTTIRQALGTPVGRPAAHAWLEARIEELKADGFIAGALARSGQRGVVVAPAADSHPFIQLSGTVDTPR